jgi:hypothetical protein
MPLTFHIATGLQKGARIALGARTVLSARSRDGSATLQKGARASCPMQSGPRSFPALPEEDDRILAV